MTSPGSFSLRSPQSEAGKRNGTGMKIVQNTTSKPSPRHSRIASCLAFKLSGPLDPPLYHTLWVLHTQLHTPWKLSFMLWALQSCVRHARQLSGRLGQDPAWLPLASCSEYTASLSPAAVSPAPSGLPDSCA